METTEYRGFSIVAKDIEALTEAEIERDSIFPAYSILDAEGDEIGIAEDVEEATDMIDIYIDENDPERCPGCGSRPGDGVTEGCEHEDGCGYWSNIGE